MLRTSSQSYLALAFVLVFGACSSHPSTTKPAASPPHDAGRDAGDAGTDAGDAGIDAMAEAVFTPDANLVGPAGWNAPVTKPTDDTAAAARVACEYKAGDMPAATQGLSRPNAGDIPIDTIVVAMMENRSFDHYMQKIRDVGIDADVAPDDFTNPDPDGNPIKPYRDSLYCFVDTPHSRESVSQQLDDGKMDGFVRAAVGEWTSPITKLTQPTDPTRVMTYYTQDDIPFTYWMAQTFALGDRYFCSAPTSTWTNRQYIFAATSFGLSHNIVPDKLDKTFFDYLNQRQITWKFYYSFLPTLFIIGNTKSAEYQAQGHVVPIAQFHADAAAGTLPQVAFVDPDGVSAPDYLHTDEHPPALMQIGQRWLAQVVDSLVRGPQWEHSALFVTYDEHGGLYDHVVPPKACPPDDLVEDPLVKFDQYGLRVPFFVVSPYAKKAYVSHHVYDHTSVLRFIEARFVLPALTARDANAEAPWDAFDFEHPPAREALSVPIPEVDPDKLAACQELWGK